MVACEYNGKAWSDEGVGHDWWVGSRRRSRSGLEGEIIKRKREEAGCSRQGKL